MPKIDIRNYTDQNGSLKKELKENKDLVIERNKQYERVQPKSKLR